ncbi:MAG: hypothetical protein QOF51_2365 [Chloroflexota bacterium]|jgi:hypothetical protein|nr:hypothetical protein [Chloroflexota bacterium]
MAVAEREAISVEMRRHELVISLLADSDTVESIRVALEEEARGLEVPFSELRRKYGKHRDG